MPDIKKIKLGDDTYDIKDANAAREIHDHSGVYQPVGNYATTDGNNTYAGNNVFTNNKFAVRASGANDDSWIMLTNNVTSSYYAFGIRRPYTNYGLQLKYHPDTVNQDSSRPGAANGTSDIYYDIYHQGNYTKIPTATTSAAGLMSTGDKAKLDGIAAGANAYTHPSYTARTGVPTANATPAFGGTFSVSQPVSDAAGHITAINSRTITIPSTVATTSAAGLMSAADKTIINRFTYNNSTPQLYIDAGACQIDMNDDAVRIAASGGLYHDGNKVLTEANINYDSTNKILTIS